MESRASRRHRAQESQAQEAEPPQEKKKVKKGILKNSGKHNSKSSSQPGPGDYDVPNSGGGGGPAAKSHRNLSSSCGTIDQLEGGEAGYSQVRERSRRRHREVEDVNIYDTPKVTSVKWKEDLAAAYDMLTKNSKHGLVSAASSEPSFYENVGFNVRSEEPDAAPQQLQDNEGVYDFPRPRTVDAVYFNDNFEDEGPTYDTPRKQQEIIHYNDEDLDGTSEGEYDVPKVREATLETIEEEESQEYDVPRNNRMVGPADTPAAAAEEEEENLYENQQFVVLGAAAAAALLEHEPIYMNELADDRSSGYRSSSSPSINSEENLYENGAMLMDDFSSQGSQGSQENLIVETPGRHDVAIETTHTLERLHHPGQGGDKRPGGGPRGHSAREAATRTPEEGICLEFEEFNPEVTEKQNRHQQKQQQQKFRDKNEKLKDFNHSFKHDNKDVNLFDDVSTFNKNERNSPQVIPTQVAEFVDNQNVIYSKPDKKKKEQQKVAVAKSNEKNLVRSTTVDNSRFQQQRDFTPFKKETISAPPPAPPPPSAAANDVQFEPIIENKINLADKIGIFENNKNSSSLEQRGPRNRNTVKNHININNNINNNNNNYNNNYNHKLRANKKAEEARDNLNASSKHQQRVARPEEQQQARAEVEAPRTPKTGRERDRGVEVYMETVRQRSQAQQRADKKLTAELLFARPPPPAAPAAPATPEESRTDMSSRHSAAAPSQPRHEDESPSEAGDPVGLPSVRKLLARFEGGEGGDQAGRRLAKSHGAAQLQEREQVPQPRAPPSQPTAARRSPHSAEVARPSAAAPSPSFRAVERRVVTEVSSPPEECAESAGGEQEPVRHWDPQYVVRCLYTMEASPATAAAEDPGQASCPSIEGYMERLPPGRKKSTMWNSWKKQYFVARGGVLHVYESRAQDTEVDKFEMFGGNVDFMDSNMLGIQDRRGQYIVVRCASHRAAQEWESALSFHTQEDYASTFVSPAPAPAPALTAHGGVIVIDLGGASVRAGFSGAGAQLPRVFFPSVMAVHPGNTHEKYFGLDALKPDIRATCSLSYPLLPSRKVDKYSVDLVALCGLLLRVFKDLQVDPKKHELQLSVPRNFNDKTKAAIASLLFDEFEVAAVNMGHQTVFALHSYRAHTGIVVDIGERMDVVPIVAGYKVQAGISRTTTGGGELVARMKQALLGRNYSLTAAPALDSYVVRHVVQQLCYIPRSYDQELEKLRADPGVADKAVSVDAEASQHITLGLDRFETAEGIFKPELWGLDQAGIHVLVKKAVAEVSLDARKEVTRSIFLSGGTTMIPGFAARLEAELGRLLPARPRVHASPHRYHAAYLGACQHAASEEFERAKIRREDWVAGSVRNMASLWVL